MADDVTRDFLLEQFRIIRSEFSKVNDRLDRLERRVGKLVELVGSLVRDHFEREREFSALDARLRRVEDRLELRDA